jgi:signal transduction histidine kinase
VLVIVAPLGVLAGLSVQRAWRRQLANVDRQNVANVRAISVAVDQQIEKTAAALDVLGELHALDSPDLPAFQSLAARILPYQPNWTAILLATTSGGRIDAVPDSRDGDASVHGVNWAQAAAAAKRPIVSDMFELPDTPGHFLMVAVPVIRDGRIARVLGARIKTESLSETLRAQKTPTTGAVAIVDRTGRIVARNADEAQYVGGPATPAFLEVADRSDEGAFRATMRDGRPTYAAFSRSSRTGLKVGLGLPAEEVDGPIRRILWLLAGAWAVVLVLGAGIGLAFGQVIVRAMSSASSAAMALARGEPVSPPPSRIAEIDALASGLRRASDTMQARNRERDEASRLKDEFLMTISHELRTPLTAICGWARMLSTGQIREAQRGKAIETIERNATSLQQLVDDLLDVSRIVTGKLRLEIQSVALSELLSGAVDAIRPAADAKSIQVTMNVDPEAACLPADPGRLQQIVWNLLANAVKFTLNGGRIDVESRRVGDNIELRVSDTGVGIDPDFLPHAFERFRQAASGTTRSPGGLGLGLSIVRHLVELHGGTVTGENNVPPPGATFRVVLPAPIASTYSAGPGWPTSATTPRTAAR